jgi:hypothetical protein
MEKDRNVKKKYSKVYSLFDTIISFCTRSFDLISGIAHFAEIAAAAKSICSHKPTYFSHIP